MQPTKDGITTCTIPYIKGISEARSRVLAPLEIRTVMTPRQIKWTLMKDVKDKLPKDQEPSVVRHLVPDVPQCVHRRDSKDGQAKYETTRDAYKTRIYRTICNR